MKDPQYAIMTTLSFHKVDKTAVLKCCHFTNDQLYETTRANWAEVKVNPTHTHDELYETA